MMVLDDIITLNVFYLTFSIHFNMCYICYICYIIEFIFKYKYNNIQYVYICKLTTGKYQSLGLLVRDDMLTDV